MESAEINKSLLALKVVACLAQGGQWEGMGREKRPHLPCWPTGVHQGPGTEQGSYPFPREQADAGAEGLLHRGELPDLHGEFRLVLAGKKGYVPLGGCLATFVWGGRVLNCERVLSVGYLLLP